MTYIKKQSQLVKAFPAELHTEVKDFLRKSKELEVWDDSYVIHLYEQDVLIPKRVVFLRPLIPNDASEVELCVRTRSTDGYEREQALDKLANTKLTQWALPFILLSLGDYVIDVSTVAMKNEGLEYPLRRLAKHNASLTTLLEQQSISYWNEYYKQSWASFDEYPPYKYLKKLQREFTSREGIKYLQKIMPKDIYKAHKHSTENRSEIQASKICGCFYCLHTFEPNKIWEWIKTETEEFPMCPYCGIDSVIGDASGYSINDDFLRDMNKHWFDGDAIRYDFTNKLSSTKQ